MLSLNYIFDLLGHYFGGESAFSADLKSVIRITPGELRRFVQRGVYDDIRAYDRPGAPSYSTDLRHDSDDLKLTAVDAQFVADLHWDVVSVAGHRVSDNDLSLAVFLKET